MMSSNQGENGVSQNTSEKKQNTHDQFKSNEYLENSYEENQISSQSYPILLNEKFQSDQTILYQNQQQQKQNQQIKLQQHLQAQNDFLNKQKNIKYKEDINRKSSQRNSLSQEKNEMIQIKNLYSSDNTYQTKQNNNFKESSTNMDQLINPLVSSSYAISQRRGEFYSPREEDKYKSFKSAITSKLFKSNQQSPSYTPRNSVYANNSSREGSQTYRLRMGRMKVSQDGFFKKSKNSYFHQKNILSCTDQNESSESKQQLLFQQQQQQQQQADIQLQQQQTPQQQQIQFPINQQIIQSMLMNHSSQKKMKQFLQNNGLSNFLNQHQQGLQKQQAFSSQMYSKTPGQSSNLGNLLLSSAQKSQNSKNKNPPSSHQQAININPFSSQLQQHQQLQQQQQQQVNNALNSSRISHKESKQNNNNFPPKQSLLEEIYCSFDSINYLKNKGNKKNLPSNQIQSNVLQAAAQQINNQKQIQQLQQQQQHQQQQQNLVFQLQQNQQQTQQNSQQIQQLQSFQQNQISLQQPQKYQNSNRIQQQFQQNNKQQQDQKINQQKEQYNQDQTSQSENQINYLKLISGTEPLSRKISISNSNNINMSKSNYISQQVSGNMLNQMNYASNNVQRNTSIHMMTPNKSTAASLSNNNTSGKNSMQKKLQNSQNVIQFHQIFQQQHNQSNQQSDQQIQSFQQSQDQQKILNPNNTSTNSYTTTQEQNSQQQQQQQQLSRITTQANTTNFTTNNSNHINNNNITTTNHWDSTTQDSLYFKKKIKEINKIENLFHRKDSLPEGNVILQGYSSKNKEQVSKRYVIDDTDIVNLGVQNDDAQKQNVIKRDAQTARKKSAKQKNSFNNQEQNIYQITLKNICNFPIKVNHSIGKIKNTNTNPLNTRRSSINSQLNENNNRLSQVEQDKLKDIFICQSPKSSNKKSQQSKMINNLNQNYVSKSHNLQQLQSQPIKNQFQDIDLNIFHQFISNNTQQFQISLAKRINSKLKFLKDRIQNQEEENNNIKLALKMSEDLDSQLFRNDKNQASSLSNESYEIYQNGIPATAINSSRSNSLSSLSYNSIQNY